MRYVKTCKKCWAKGARVVLAGTLGLQCLIFKIKFSTRTCELASTLRYIECAGSGRVQRAEGAAGVALGSLSPLHSYRLSDRIVGLSSLLNHGRSNVLTDACGSTDREDPRIAHNRNKLLEQQAWS